MMPRQPGEPRPRDDGRFVRDYRYTPIQTAAFALSADAWPTVDDFADALAATVSASLAATIAPYDGLRYRRNDLWFSRRRPVTRRRVPRAGAA
jgi:hypothetical protein